MMSESQRVMKNQHSQMLMNQLIHLSHMMINQSQSQRRLNNRSGGGYASWQLREADPAKFMFNNLNHSRSSLNKGNWKMKKPNNTDRLNPRRSFSKKKFNHSGKTAPYAPRNTTSFLIRAKKSGGITSLVTPSPVTPVVLPTLVFSPTSEVLVDTAKEEWGVDGYGSMKGLIRVRCGGNDDEDEGGSSESEVDEHVEVEGRLDHDLSRFEMVYPSYGVVDHVLENRVDDQDTHIAQLEEENLVLKDRLLLIEREFSNLRTRLQSLEKRKQGLKEEEVENESENEECNEVLEENNVDIKESDNGSLKGASVGEGRVTDVHMEDSMQKIEENTDCVDEDIED